MKTAIRPVETAQKRSNPEARLPDKPGKRDSIGGRPLRQKSHHFGISSPEKPLYGTMVRRLPGGGRWIRTVSSGERGFGVGEHEPIIDQLLWDAVQAQLASNSAQRIKRLI
jgi:hypothetical protein